jgi:predicted nucleotidyltransferase
MARFGDTPTGNTHAVGRSRRLEVAPVPQPPAADADLDATLREAVVALEAAGLPYLLIGGLAATLLGRPRHTRDIDLFVRQVDAQAALAALAEAGFDTEETNPAWIFKAFKRDVTVDLIFWLLGEIYLDDEMLARARRLEWSGTPVTVMPPEDLVVVKAIVHDEQNPHHWHDALGIVAGCELDWEYLASRARHGARRVLALLVYAQANDLVVTDETVRRLYESVYR